MKRDSSPDSSSSSAASGAMAWATEAGSGLGRSVEHSEQERAGPQISTMDSASTASAGAAGVDVRPHDAWHRLAARFARMQRFPFALFFYTRLAYLACSWMGMTLVPSLYMHEEGRHRALQPYPWIDGLCRWDCGWFDTIVKQGFSVYENAKVFPLFPAMAWALKQATGMNHLVALILIANVASLASYVVVYRLFSALEGDAAARWGLCLFAAYPFAFFQAAAYPESLMVLCSAWSLLLALRGRHIYAGTVLGLGVMARHLTLFGGAALLAVQLRDRGFHPKRFLGSWSFLGLIVPFLFVGAFAWHLQVMVGDPLAFWHARTINFGPEVWWSVRELLQHTPYAKRPEYYYYVLFALIPAIGSAALLLRRRWWILAANGVCLMLVVFSSGGVALGRYSAACWPAYLPLGLWLSTRPNLQAPVLMSMTLIQGIFFFLFSHQFHIL
jgi:hypothetical protein